MDIATKQRFEVLGNKEGVQLVRKYLTSNPAFVIIITVEVEDLSYVKLFIIKWHTVLPL